MQKRKRSEIDWDDGEIPLEDDFDVDGFIEQMERRDARKRRLSARRRLEERDEEAYLRNQLIDWDD